MATMINIMSYDEEGAKRKAKKREAELALCTSNAEVIALKHVWAIEDMPRPVVNHYHRSSGGGLGLFGLFGIL